MLNLYPGIGECYDRCQEWKGGSWLAGKVCTCNICKEQYTRTPILTLKFLKESGCKSLDDLRPSRHLSLLGLKYNGHYYTCESNTDRHY